MKYLHVAFLLHCYVDIPETCDEIIHFSQSASTQSESNKHHIPFADQEDQVPKVQGISWSDESLSSTLIVQIFYGSGESNRDIHRFDEVENACLLLHDLSEPFFVVCYASIKLIVCSLDC